MRLRDIIRAPKRISGDTGWKRRQKMPRNVFPLSRNRKYPIPAKWDGWRVVEFEALGRGFRLLVAFDAGFEQYRAWLGAISEDDTIMLARLEYHSTHVGWHVHADCDGSSGRTAGIVKGFGEQRFPKAKSFHRRAGFGITEVNALGRAFEFFGIDDRNVSPDGGLV